MSFRIIIENLPSNCRDRRSIRKQVPISLCLFACLRIVGSFLVRPRAFSLICVFCVLVTPAGLYVPSGRSLERASFTYTRLIDTIETSGIVTGVSKKKLIRTSSLCSVMSSGRFQICLGTRHDSSLRLIHRTITLLVLANFVISLLETPCLIHTNLQRYLPHQQRRDHTRRRKTNHGLPNKSDTLRECDTDVGLNLVRELGDERNNRIC